MPRPCLCDRGDCRRCHLYHHSQRYRTAWGGDQLPPEAPPGGLRVVHVGYAIVRAGAENHLESLVRWLPKERVRITRCIATSHASFDPDMARGLGIPASVGGMREVREALAEADVLLCWGGPLGEWLAGARPKLSVFVAHGETEWTRKILGNCAPIIDHVVAVSERVKEANCKGWPTTVIPNGIDRARIAPTRPRAVVRRALGFDPKDIVLTYVGRFSPEKRPEAVIEAVALLPPRYKALLVGWGALESRLRERAEELIPGRYAFTYAQDDVGDYYQACDAIVLCSRQEGFPLALVEAFFSDRPVIATPAGCIPELLERSPVVLRVDGSPGATADAAISLRDPRVRKPLIKAGRDYAEQHGYARAMAERYATLIERLWEIRHERQPTIVGPLCRHWGRATGDTVKGCSRCPTHACAVHGACAVRNDALGVMACVRCPDGEARDGPVPSELKIRVPR